MQQTDIEFIRSDLLCAGVDEAGRGPLAGPVVAATVILPINYSLSELGLSELTDSKKLSQVKRDALFPLIKQHALAWGIACANREEIDKINILQASLLAMSRSLSELDTQPQQILIDGNKLPILPKHLSHIEAHAIVKGDSKVPAISAASVLAKVTRDRILMEMHEKYPEYGFAQHKGYPTKAHLAMLSEHGPCPEHRQSFKPVKDCLAK